MSRVAPARADRRLLCDAHALAKHGEGLGWLQFVLMQGLDPKSGPAMPALEFGRSKHSRFGMRAGVRCLARPLAGPLRYARFSEGEESRVDGTRLIGHRRSPSTAGSNLAMQRSCMARIALRIQDWAGHEAVPERPWLDRHCGGRLQCLQRL